MSIDMNPVFKGALIVHFLLVVFLSLITIIFMTTPLQVSLCVEKMPNDTSGYRTYPPRLSYGGAAFYTWMAVATSIVVLVVGIIGFHKQSATILRHLRIGITAGAVFSLLAIIELQHRISFFMGETWGRWEELGCTYLSFVCLFCTIPMLDAYLKSIGDELSFFDYLFAWVYYVRNVIKYGRQGISFTTSFVRSQVQTRMKKSVRVSQKNDTLFREVEIGSRMFGAITLELLKENIAHKYDRHPNEIIRLTKNGNVLIVDDSDVMRIGNEDHIEVEFEDVGTRLREVDSVMLEDSISETTVDL